MSDFIFKVDEGVFQVGNKIALVEQDLEGGKHIVVLLNSGGLYGVLDDNCKLVIPFNYRRLQPIEGNPDRLIAQLPTKNGTKYGVLDASGYAIVPFVYEKLDLGFEGNFYAANKMLRGKKDGKMGMIDENNMVVVPFEYDLLESAEDDATMMAVKDGKLGYLDKTGQVLVPFEYDEPDGEILFRTFIVKHPKHVVNIPCDHAIFVNDFDGLFNDIVTYYEFLLYQSRIKHLRSEDIEKEYEMVTDYLAGVYAFVEGFDEEIDGTEAFDLQYTEFVENTTKDENE